MEGKTPFANVIMGVLILSLVVAKIQVEGKLICCPTTYIAKYCHDIPLETCAKMRDCKITDKDNCPILGNSGAINEYCKLGCASSVCNAISTLQNSGEEVVMNRAVEQCTKACSAFCTMGAIETV